MFPRYTSLVLPSLARRQANAVEFATKVCFSLFDGLEAIAQLTSVQKGNCATCSSSETCDLLSIQIYIHRYLPIVAVHYGSYLRANNIPVQSYRSAFRHVRLARVFLLINFVQILYLFVQPRFLQYSAIYVL